MKQAKQAVTAVRVNRVASSDSFTLKRLILVQEEQMAALKREVAAKTAVASAAHAILGDVLLVEKIDPNTGEVFGVTELFGG